MTRMSKMDKVKDTAKGVKIVAKKAASVKLMLLYSTSKTELTL